MGQVNYKIIHQLPGRLRVRIPRLLIDANYRDQLESRLESEQGITSFRLNDAAQSLMVCYDQKNAPQQHCRLD